MWFSAHSIMASSQRSPLFLRSWLARHPKWLAGLQYAVATLLIGLLLAGATLLVTRLEAQLPSPVRLVVNAAAGPPLSARV